MRGLRKALPAAACAERSARIVEHLLGLDAIQRARSVALFWPIEERHEVDLRPLDAVLRERGARVAYPAVDPETHAMTFRFVALPDSMQRQGLAVVEPSGAEPEAGDGDLDAIVIPALAVDPAGQRVGYGAGYYDNALPRFAPPAVTIAVAFDFQLLAEVPITEGDVATEWIVTDSRILKAEIGPSAG